MQMKIGSNSSLLNAQTVSGETQYLENESARDQNILPLDQSAVSGASVAEPSFENISEAFDSFATNTPQLLASKRLHAFHLSVIECLIKLFRHTLFKFSFELDTTIKPINQLSRCSFSVNAIQKLVNYFNINH